jgi:hypothetical protein
LHKHWNEKKKGIFKKGDDKWRILEKSLEGFFVNKNSGNLCLILAIPELFTNDWKSSINFYPTHMIFGPTL